jgi:hypothetical protein
MKKKTTLVQKKLTLQKITISTLLHTVGHADQDASTQCIPKTVTLIVL